MSVLDDDDYDEDDRKYKDYVYGNVSAGVLDKSKEHYSRCQGKAETSYDGDDDDKGNNFSSDYLTMTTT